MISICIPVYNFNITSLIHSLLKQLNECNLIFEILVIDDASQIYKKENREIKVYDTIRYIELPKNIGRTLIRNLLVREAVYTTLLFIDCDAKVTSPFYIHNYTKFIGKKVIICGGTIYQITNPFNLFYLHWKYGSRREQRTAQQRNLNPNISFTTFNFLVHKKILEEIKFDEFLTEYGHEDTLLGIKLQQKGLIIQHIDNPLLHNGLEVNTIFLEKTKKGIENLLFIEKTLPDTFVLFTFSNLVRTYQYLKKWKLLNVFAIKFKILESILLKNILGTKPSLFLFDLYKLGYYTQLKRQKKDKITV